MGSKDTIEFDQRVFYEHAEVCKVLANPKRLMILYLLSSGDKKVGDIASALGITVANTSQHLARLREKGIVATRKEGASIYYTIVDSRIPRACDLIRASLLDRLKRQGRLAKRIENMEQGLKTQTG